jgi:hypothetical protein
MPQISDVGSRFETEYRTITGKRIKGHLWERPPQNVGATAFGMSRRVLKVRPTSGAVARDIIVGLGGRRYLLMNGPDSEVGGIHAYRLYLLAEVDRQLPLTRTLKQTDPFTGMAGLASTADLGLVWCALEPLGTVENLNHLAVRYRILTHTHLQIEDRMGDYTVKRVETLLGVTVAEVA